MHSARRFELALAAMMLVTAGCSTSSSPRGPQLVEQHGNRCLERGWKRTTIQIEGVEREVWWRGPAGGWPRGAIVAFHGGGGAGSNFCANVAVGAPQVEFADQAIARGFAVFAPDSTAALRDEHGLRCGKRWDSLAHPDRPNRDLGLVAYVLDTLIPDKRPPTSSTSIFATGISNGGFMTVLVASQFGSKLQAFVPMSSGDPFGTYIDCREELSALRRNAPGIFADSTTKRSLAEVGACTTDSHMGETPMAPAPGAIPFKLAFDPNDGAVDVTCKHAANARLVAAGFVDAGAIVLPANGERDLFHHFWQSAYNERILAFFEAQPVAR